jgi:hypothetical protein
MRMQAPSSTLPIVRLRLCDALTRLGNARASLSCAADGVSTSHAASDAQSAHTDSDSSTVETPANPGSTQLAGSCTARVRHSVRCTLRRRVRIASVALHGWWPRHAASAHVAYRESQYRTGHTLPLMFPPSHLHAHVEGRSDRLPNNSFSATADTPRSPSPSQAESFASAEGSSHDADLAPPSASADGGAGAPCSLTGRGSAMSVGETYLSTSVPEGSPLGAAALTGTAVVADAHHAPARRLRPSETAGGVQGGRSPSKKNGARRVARHSVDETSLTTGAARCAALRCAALRRSVA